MRLPRRRELYGLLVQIVPADLRYPQHIIHTHTSYTSQLTVSRRYLRQHAYIRPKRAIFDVCLLGVIGYRSGNHAAGSSFFFAHADVAGAIFSPIGVSTPMVRLLACMVAVVYL